jgi:hypothetical protein
MPKTESQVLVMPSLQSLGMAFLEHSLLCLAWRPPVISDASRPVLDGLTLAQRDLLEAQRVALGERFMEGLRSVAHPVLAAAPTQPELALLRWSAAQLPREVLAEIDGDVLLRQVGQIHSALLQGRIQGVEGGVDEGAQAGFLHDRVRAVAGALALLAIRASQLSHQHGDPRADVPSWIAVEPLAQHHWAQLLAPVLPPKERLWHASAS